MTGLKYFSVFNINIVVKQLYVLFFSYICLCLFLFYHLEAAAKFFTNKIYNKGTFV